MIKRFFILLLATVASIGMSFAQDPGIVSSGTKGGMSYTFYDNGLLEISGSGALPGQAFTNWDGGFGTSVKNIRFAEDCEVYGLDYLWFGCYTENSQLETVEINSVAPILFSGTSGAGIFYRQDGAVTLTITAPGIVDVENRIIDTYRSPVNMIFNMPATTVFERKWFSGLENYFAVTIPTGAKGHIPAGYVFKDSYDQEDYDRLVADGYEDMFWDSHSHLEEGVDYTLGEESTFVITAENASQIFGQAAVSFQAPTEASNSEWVLWRKSDLKEFPDMSPGDQKVCKDVTVKVNNGVYNTDSGFGVHFESLAEDGVQFVAPEGKVFKRIVILNQYGTFSDPNWSYDGNYKRWSGSADTVGFVGDICGISLIEFELGDSAPTPSGDGDKLSGAFSVSASQVVYFSRGNLQYQASTNTWRFAENQYDAVGGSNGSNNAAPYNTSSANHSPSASQTGWIDLFGWAASGITRTGVTAYQPYSTSTNNADYGTTTTKSASETLGNYDWGKNMGDGWRTLTAEEWGYLIGPGIGGTTPSEYRDHYHSLRGLCKITVSGTDYPGLMILPDDMYNNLPTEGDIASKWSACAVAATSMNYTKATFTEAEWTALQAAGAVFLPAAGYRYTTVNYAGAYGDYWSSSASSDKLAFFLRFYAGYLTPENSGNRYNGRSVRLVSDIAPDPAAPAYETVMNLINAIGTVELTAECKAKIDAARAAFIALSDGDKTQVTNYETLTTAEAAFDNVMDIWLSGDCDAILWKDTTLTIRKHAGEGNGAMADYTSYYGNNTAPWFNSHWYNPQPGDIVIKSVTIEEGVTHIGENAFGWMSELKTVTIPSSMTSIGEDAFYWSKAVDDIYLTADPSNLTWVLPHSADNQFKPEKATRCHVPADLLTAYQEKFGTLNVTFVGDLDPITPLTPEQQQALDAAKDKIAAIPSPVVYTPACKDAIDAARAAYDALTPDMLKQLVSNYATLTAAETTYANLKDVVVVEAKINAIPQPVTLKLATRDSIESARAAYDALTDDQKALVSNYQILLDAEATMATLNPGGGMPADALNGKFTINAGGDQIAFAKGNLQATTEDLGAHWTWGFAANQWNYLGIAVANNAISGNGTVSENGTVDLFGWSTAATYYGINNSYKAVDYIGDFVDWGPNMGAGWRTLTKDEWQYLIENNTKGRATVNDKNGYIFLPNDWSGPAFTPDPDNFTTNVYSGDDWIAMENAGAVFLPSGPARNGKYALIANDAKYSSSTSLNNDTSYVFTIYYNQSQSACTGTNRAYGCMVRLVTEGGGATPLDSAQAVKDLIEAIPMPVTLEDACVNAVQAARDAYNALSDATKGALDDATVQKLNQAIADYTALIQAGADEVIAKINNIPQPVTLKLATRDSIESARAAYDALTADQKLLVSNYDVLTAAEATWAGLTNVAPTGALSGKYTINDGGDVIYFAHGNLQYTRENLDADWSTGTFRLAENQYDLIELDKTYPAAYCTDNYGDKIAVGLFGWGTWGEGKTPNLTSSDRTLYTWSTDFSGTLEGTDTWRTLTKDEWVYLLAHNNQSYATVHGVNGLLVAPDGKDIDGKSMADWVEINDETWTTMQNDGYLFLPACGQRSRMSETANITTGDQGEDVVYYSSTEYSNVYAYNIWYKPGQDPKADDYSNKRQAFGIRLVSAGVNPLDQVQVVKGLIDAIPVPVTLDDACVNAVQAARAGYDALDTDAKAILDAADVKKLTDAEAALTALNQAVADEVIAKINNIPTPVELKLATRDSINNARAAYDALNAAQQALVSNYQTLLDAEAALAEKNPGVPPATPLDSAQAVKDLIDAIPTPVEYPTSGPAIAAALNAFNELSDAAKGALDAADVQKLNDAATLYAALEAIAAIEAIPAEIVYDPAVKVAIETAREKYDALSDASKELVDDEVVAKLTNAEQAWADLVAKVEHNVSYMGKDGELKNEKVALLHIPDPAPDFNGYEFVRWDVKGGDFLEEGLRIKAVYTPIITTNPQGFDTLAYNGLAQELVEAGVAKEGHIEYSLYPEEPESWSAELPKATFAGVYAIYYKLVREGHADYIAPEPTMATIAKVPVTYTAPTAVEALVYNASNQTLIAAGQTQDGTFEYSLDPTLLDSWKAELPQAKDAGTYRVYYRVQGDLNHLDSTAVDPIAVTIAKAPLTATADDKSIIYGDLAPEFTVTYAGWQGDDDASVLAGEIAYACEYVKGNPVGEYVITPSGVDANNYTIEFVNGKLTVNSKSAKSDDITAKQADNEILVYDAAANKPTIQAKDTTKTLVEDTDYKLTFIGRGETEYAESATAPAHVGEYTAIVAFIGNYTDTLTVDFTINKAPLTITADDKEVTFGEFAPEFTVSYEGWQGKDTATVLTGSQAYACEYVRGNQIGDYTIIPSGVDAHDYAITFVNGTLTVNRKSAKSADITAKQADNEKLVYDAEANRPTIQVKDTTLVLTEAQDYVLTFMGVAADQTPYAESETAPTHVGNYKAIVAFIGNYIDTLTVDFTINKAPLTITANDTAMIYGDEHPEFTVSYNGWFGNDDESVILGTQAYDCIYAPGSPIGTYVITPKDVDAYDYAITFVDGTLTVNKAHVYVSDAEAQIAKFADGHANAVVLEQGILNGIKLNDPIAHVTTAAFSSADVAEHLTITLFYELTGDAALLNNYYLDPTSDIFTNEGVIIEPFIPDNEEKPEDKEATVNEGIEIYAYGYCDGSGYSLKYHLESGNPDQYKIDFADSRFTDVDWTNLVITGKDGTIDIEIPVDMPTGDYTMTVYFRDSRFDWLESRQFNVTFHVNLPETYVRPLFDNVIALVDTCECLTDIQWYWRANSTDLWQPIEGANGYYYHVDGKLTGEYFVAAKMNGEPTFTCGQADMETLYGADQQAEAPVVRAYPNPVVNSTTVTIENSIEWIHNIRIVNLMGAEVMNATFEGDKTNVEMSGYPQGNYMISVDGIVVKVMKK